MLNFFQQLMFLKPWNKFSVSIFNNATKKSCPLCKSLLSFEDWKINNIINNIEKILDKNNEKKNKVEDLSKLIEQKKKEWNKQTLNINSIIQKINLYKNLLNHFLQVV